MGVWMGVLIIRFKAKSQFKLDLTGTKLELSLAKQQYQQQQLLQKTTSIQLGCDLIVISLVLTKLQTKTNESNFFKAVIPILKPRHMEFCSKLDQI